MTPVDLQRVRDLSDNKRAGDIETLVCEYVPAMVTEIEALRHEAARLRKREADIIEACERVADGGQFRADIVSAIQRIRRERDAAHGGIRKAIAAMESMGPEYFTFTLPDLRALLPKEST